MKNQAAAFFCLLPLLASAGITNVFTPARSIGAQEASASQTQARAHAQSGIEERIKRVENGLLAPLVMKGQGMPMRLADRMKSYKTPGISIAVIDKGRVEWARGYGVKNART